MASINKGRRTEINDFAGQQDISGRVDRYRFSTRAFTLQDELEDAVWVVFNCEGRGYAFGRIGHAGGVNAAPVVDGQPARNLLNARWGREVPRPQCIAKRVKFHDRDVVG